MGGGKGQSKNRRVFFYEKNGRAKKKGSWNLTSPILQWKKWNFVCRPARARLGKDGGGLGWGRLYMKLMFWKRTKKKMLIAHSISLHYIYFHCNRISFKVFLANFCNLCRTNYCYVFLNFYWLKNKLWWRFSNISGDFWWR